MVSAGRTTVRIASYPRTWDTVAVVAPRTTGQEARHAYLSLSLHPTHSLLRPVLTRRLRLSVTMHFLYLISFQLIGIYLRFQRTYMCVCVYVRMCGVNTKIRSFPSTGLLLSLSLPPCLLFDLPSADLTGEKSYRGKSGSLIVSIQKVSRYP
ncbi:uncharacterized protein BO97DRAFT_72444 [Aspergillus homomorphus CBS 101889]|uniref:Uncharacterized protein n=1 Tax=Aspergillus homomorphus (strain CBS 101889) TaxID=1450537 RepID=A0A395I9N4_ASPHC|nr:hypothetical protein BO97DRAFT_72444 [Aspergillus homomorphus CBS 101889]RAL16675.1 hypothetical protein BO97DRAFT_72444 [Aspergillus homomorphus CBS 101889]